MSDALRDDVPIATINLHLFNVYKGKDGLPEIVGTVDSQQLREILLSIDDINEEIHQHVPMIGGKENPQPVSDSTDETLQLLHRIVPMRTSDVADLSVTSDEYRRSLSDTFDEADRVLDRRQKSDQSP
ncbi:hypothetical protein A3D88_04185 [Candidatus Peribacteria bacterium RIFCSPHIGHO2_02_FULL_52_16]|nr:MAG: hypothetical protein A2706_00930 [Candidatus Peribacteria bacterium RIFCSPHIGHO2_01_FULL_51_35]OGJ60814.1 MAG: hypothetical protein A3D88_04185 [Candidatus Peribacteria bacterium RIFCSPHIGHO2_02_FULL_52_16]